MYLVLLDLLAKLIHICLNLSLLTFFNIQHQSLVQVSCGETIRYNGTYFRNPGAPAPFSDSRACSVTVARPQPNICQIRLDFLKFDLDRPRTGVCENDRFVVSGQASNSITPPICGYNTGQHMYLDLDQSNYGPVTLNIITIGSRPRLFDIRVTYIHCASPHRGKFAATYPTDTLFI